jgi:hypothetical protein
MNGFGRELQLVRPLRRCGKSGSQQCGAHRQSKYRQASRPVHLQFSFTCFSSSGAQVCGLGVLFDAD